METVVKLDRLISDASVSFSMETSGHYRTTVACRRQLADVWARMEARSGSYRQLSGALVGCPEPPQAVFTAAFSDTLIGCIDLMLGFHDAVVRNVAGGCQGDWVATLVTPLRSLVDRVVLEVDGDGVELLVAVPKLMGKLTVACELLAWLTLAMGLLENMTRPLR